jgi:hypothetical protein
MANAPNPKSPVRADYRFIKQVIGSILEGKVEPRPEEFDLVCKVFTKKGGSWERIFKGSPQDVSMLKDILKAAFDGGYLTAKAKWDGEKEDEKD